MNESLPASVARLAIAGEFNIYTAAEHFARLQHALADHPGLDLDLGEVSEIDSAGVQLLLWAGRQAAGQGGRLRILAWSESVAEVVQLLQLDAALTPVGQRSGGEDLA